MERDVRAFLRDAQQAANAIEQFIASLHGERYELAEALAGRAGGSGHGKVERDASLGARNRIFVLPSNNHCIVILYLSISKYRSLLGGRNNS